MLFKKTHRTLGSATVKLDALTLPIDLRNQASRLLDLIQNAESMTQANRNGAVAEGFVLGIATLRTMDPATLERMDVLFCQATKRRLQELSL